MFETLAFGYGLLEGPRQDAAGHLYFSDVTRGGVYRRTPDGAIDTVVPKRRGVGGIALHRDGGIVLSGKNVCHVRDGVSRTLLAVEGVPGFNDLTTDALGRVYVGSLRSDPFAPGGGPRTPGELYRIGGDGTAEVLYGDVGLSNGIGFSPAGDRLYHSDTAAGAVWLHDVDAAGQLSGRRVFATLPRGRPDGLAVDEAGRVWIASYGGGCALCYAAEGQLADTLEVPARAVTSLCFGGADRRDLIVVSADNSESPERGGTLFRTRVDVPGLPVPLAAL